MLKSKEDVKDKFVQGVIDTVAAFEKKASFQSWMQYSTFNKKFSEKVASIIQKVKGGDNHLG